MWEIYSYGGGDFLRMIFTGIAQIFGNSDYKAALQSAALIGFIGVLIYAAFQKCQLDVKWVVGIIMTVMILIVPKVNVIIIDRVVPANSAVVGNVPLGLGLTSTAFSKVGDWLTRSFETVFSLPDEVKYSGNGLLFASNLIEESTRFEITTPRISSNFIEFWKSCVYYDLSLGLYSWDQLISSSNLVGFLGSNTSQTRSFTYQDYSGGKSIIGCRTGLSNQLTNDLNNEISNSTNIHGVRLVPNESTMNASVSRFASSLPIAYQYLTGMSLNNARIIGQNVLANSLKRGLTNFASEADAAAAAQDFALARAEQERRTTFTVMGKLAKRMLPIMRNIFEAFIYAIFPIVMLVAMLPVAGKVLFGYVKVLFWINMWAPLYAVLHFAMSYYGQKAASAAVVQAGSGFPTGLSVMTNTGLGHVLSDYAAIAGYLSLSIPMISWMMVSQSGAMMAGLAGRMMQSYDNPVSKAADEATTGNQKLGNVKYETESAFQSNSAPSDMRSGMTTGDGVGNTQRIAPDGGVYSDITSSNTPLGINYGSMATSSAGQSLSAATAQEKSTALKTVESNTALRSEIDSVVDRVTGGESGSQSLGSSERQSITQAMQNTERVMEQFSERNGLSLQNAKAISAEIYSKIEAGGEFGFAEVKAGASARAGVEEKMITQDDYTKVRDMLSSQEYSEAIRAEGAAVRDATATAEVGTQDGSEHGLSAVLSNQLQSTKDHSAAVREVEQASKQLDYTQSVSAQIQAKGDDAFFSWLSSEKGMSNSEVRQLITEANHGDLDAMKYRDAYAQEYVSNELSQFSQNQISQDGLKTGTFNGESSEFAPVDGVAQTFTNNSENDINSKFESDRTTVALRDYDNYNAVQAVKTAPSKSEATETIASIRSDAENTLASPKNAIMTPINNDNVLPIKTKQDEILQEVEEQQEKGVIDRAVEGVKNWFN
ncbi:conjugal transfer protein TraG N-terminal domain-containing protein [Candidatus Enterovibrio escicola]|uniref:Plasmid conjugative transfer protein TraG n=1 Tax=Candidatus Enterovibrio escicola TaxID=1927127 RepID=A0A2A5T7C8_9GAMM|nr:conjugal transfer protein TraG N-terminal domain-containing protein [Candidatus Enterovibrio escacola]PCS24028.1 plasmid conjugative transfer protein TraG [Candidatus Enterovibrio escacola]